MCRQEIYVRLAGVEKDSPLARVLLVTGSFPPMRCGVGDYAFKLSQALTRFRLDVGVLTSVAAGHACGPSNVTVFPTITSWRLRDLWRFIATVRAWSPDIVHIQYPSQGYAGVLMPSLLPITARLMFKRVVQTWHEVETPRGKGWKYFLLRGLFSGHVVVVRPKYEDQLPPAVRATVWLKKFLYIPNGSVIPKVALTAEEHAATRGRYLQRQRRIIVFFGFIFPHKGLELLFDIAEPNTDRIVVAGMLDEQSAYAEEIARRASSPPWQGNVDLLGFAPLAEMSALLSVADAVVLPFRGGGGEWNSSIHAAVSHGCFVVTTSTTKVGYDEASNIYYAAVDDVSDMKRAVQLYAGRRKTGDNCDDEWNTIGAQHVALYSRVLRRERL